MFQRHRVKPSKSSSLLGMIAGIVFVFIGFTQFFHLGFFGVVWTIFAVAITVFNAINVFSNKGVSLYHVDSQITSSELEKSSSHYEDKLRQLYSLRKDHIITEEEYEKKKTEILKEKW